MKLIQAYVKRHKLADLSTALHRVPDVSGITVFGVEGWGRGKRKAEKSHPGEQARDFEKHTKVEVLCGDATVEEVVQAIRRAAHTGLAGDGVIHVSTVEDAIRIGTEERGEAAR